MSDTPRTPEDVFDILRDHDCDGQAFTREERTIISKVEAVVKAARGVMENYDIEPYPNSLADALAALDPTEAPLTSSTMPRGSAAHPLRGTTP